MWECHYLLCTIIFLVSSLGLRCQTLVMYSLCSIIIILCFLIEISWIGLATAVLILFCRKKRKRFRGSLWKRLPNVFAIVVLDSIIATLHPHLQHDPTHLALSHNSSHREGMDCICTCRVFVQLAVYGVMGSL